MTRADGFDRQYRPPRGPPRRLRFEPHADGRWQRREYDWTGCHWRPVGTEPVTGVQLEVGTELVIAVSQER